METVLINIVIIFIIFIFSFTVSTIIHEFGHYITARLFGIIPKEFIIGSKFNFSKNSINFVNIINLVLILYLILSQQVAMLRGKIALKS